MRLCVFVGAITERWVVAKSLWLRCAEQLTRFFHPIDSCTFVLQSIRTVFGIVLDLDLIAKIETSKWCGAERRLTKSTWSSMQSNMASFTRASTHGQITPLHS